MGTSDGISTQNVLDVLEDVAVLQLSLDGRMESWSRGAELIFGFSGSEVLGRSSAMLRVPTELVESEVAHALSQATRLGRTKDMGWRATKGGERTWVESSLYCRRDANGQAQGFIETLRDASAQYATDERLRALLEGSAYAVIATTTEGTITVFNGAAERLLGYRAAELIDHHTPATFHDLDEVARRSVEVSAELGRVIEPGFETFVAWTREFGQPDERSWTYVHKDGQRIPVLLSITALRGPDGVVSGYLGVARDMSEIRRARREMVEQEERLRVIFENGIDCTLLADDHGNILDLNPTTERTFGYSRSELLGQNLRVLMPESYASGHDGHLLRYREEGRRTVLGKAREVLARRVDGSCFAADLSVSEAILGGERVFIGTVRDISERKATEVERDRLKRLVEATSDFVGMADPYGRLIYQNRAGNLLIGWEADEDLADKFVPDVHPAKAAKWILENAVPIAIREGAYSHETVLRHRDGTEIPVSQVIMVHRKSSGEVEYLSTIMRDLRSQKRVESLLAKVAAQVHGVLYQLELSPDGSARFPYASAGAVELFGMSPESLAQSASSLADQLFPEDLGLFWGAILESARTLTPWNAEYRYVRSDGSIRWHRGQSTPELQKDGSVVWYGFISDVTELREATEQARRAQVELEQAISVLDAGFAMYDSDERLAICNERYAELYHLSPGLRAKHPRYEDLIRETFELHPVFLQHLPEGMGFEEWLQMRLAEFRNPEGPKLQRLGARWVRIDEQRTANGGVVCMRTDITSLKNAEFEARIQEQRLKLATSAAGIGVWELEPSTGKLAWDGRMLEMFGYDPWEFSGLYEDWLVRLHPDDAQATEAAFQTALAAGHDFKGRFRIVRPDGKVRYLDARTVASHDSDGKVERVLGVNLDITDHIENEQRLEQLVQFAQAATKAKAEFLATMSHEIRTPMNGVIGMTNLLMGTDLKGEQREYVETIRASGESLLTLINDILDFSKMEAGKLVLESIAFSLERVAMETITLFTTQAESKGVSLVHELPAVPTNVVGDPVRVRQILLNLVSNALKFTSEGHVKIALMLERGTESKVHVKFRVSDTGIGMTPEHLAKLGEAFLQADASTTRQFGGTGLGLSICRNLVEVMGGAMLVTSELGRGTTFEISLPMVVASAAETVREVVKPLPEAAPKVARILVAEDNLVNQRVITLMLRNFADEVVVARDGREAVDQFRAGSFDCVLMDCHMPEMDGLEATRTIRLLEQELGSARTPIVALTANALPGDREACLGAGMDEYLTKPVRPGDLAAALAKVLPRDGARGPAGESCSPSRVATLHDRR